MTPTQLKLWALGMACIIAVFVCINNTLAAIATATTAARVDQQTQMIDGPYRRFTFGGTRPVKDGTVVVIRVGYLPLVGDQDRWLYDRIYCPKTDVVLTPSMEPGDAIKGTLTRCRYHLSDLER